MQAKSQGLLESYNSLTDESLARHFSNPEKQKFLRKMGLITSDGRILDNESVKMHNVRKEHMQKSKKAISQALVTRAMEIERKRRGELRKKIELLEKLEQAEKIKHQARYPAGVGILPNLSDTISAHHHLLNLSSEQEKEITRIKSNNVLPCNYVNPYSQKIRPATSSHLSVASTRSQLVIRPPSGPRPSSMVRPHSTTNVRIRRPRLKRTHTAPVGTRTNQFNYISNEDKIHTNVQMTIQYLGVGVSLDRSVSNPFNVQVHQQHCGGNTICLFDSDLQPNDQFTIVSRRHTGMPLGLSLYIDRLIDSRLSSCCEYKYDKKLIIGRSGHFKVIKVEGGKECYQCQAARLQGRSGGIRMVKSAQSTVDNYTKHEEDTPSITVLPELPRKEDLSPDGESDDVTSSSHSDTPPPRLPTPVINDDPVNTGTNENAYGSDFEDDENHINSDSEKEDVLVNQDEPRISLSSSSESSVASDKLIIKEHHSDDKAASIEKYSDKSVSHSSSKSSISSGKSMKKHSDHEIASVKSDNEKVESVSQSSSKSSISSCKSSTSTNSSAKSTRENKDANTANESADEENRKLGNSDSHSFSQIEPSNINASNNESETVNESEINQVQPDQQSNDQDSTPSTIIAQDLLEDVSPTSNEVTSKSSVVQESNDPSNDEELKEYLHGILQKANEYIQKEVNSAVASPKKTGNSNTNVEKEIKDDGELVTAAGTEGDETNRSTTSSSSEKGSGDSSTETTSSRSSSLEKLMTTGTSEGESDDLTNINEIESGRKSRIGMLPAASGSDHALQDEEQVDLEITTADEASDKDIQGNSKGQESNDTGDIPVYDEVKFEKEDKLEYVPVVPSPLPDTRGSTSSKFFGCDDSLKKSLPKIDRNRFSDPREPFDPSYVSDANYDYIPLNELKGPVPLVKNIEDPLSRQASQDLEHRSSRLSSYSESSKTVKMVVPTPPASPLPVFDDPPHEEPVESTDTPPTINESPTSSDNQDTDKLSQDNTEAPPLESHDSKEVNNDPSNHKSIESAEKESQEAQNDNILPSSQQANNNPSSSSLTKVAHVHRDDQPSSSDIPVHSDDQSPPLLPDDDFNTPSAGAHTHSDDPSDIHIGDPNPDDLNLPHSDPPSSDERNSPSNVLVHSDDPDPPSDVHTNDPNPPPSDLQSNDDPDPPNYIHRDNPNQSSIDQHSDDPNLPIDSPSNDNPNLPTDSPSNDNPNLPTDSPFNDVHSDSPKPTTDPPSNDVHDDDPSPPSDPPSSDDPNPPTDLVSNDIHNDDPNPPTDPSTDSPSNDVHTDSSSNDVHSDDPNPPSDPSLNDVHSDDSNLTIDSPSNDVHSGNPNPPSDPSPNDDPNPPSDPSPNDVHSDDSNLTTDSPSNDVHSGDPNPSSNDDHSNVSPKCGSPANEHYNDLSPHSNDPDPSLTESHVLKDEQQSSTEQVSTTENERLSSNSRSSTSENQVKAENDDTQTTQGMTRVEQQTNESHSSIVPEHVNDDSAGSSEQLSLPLDNTGSNNDTVVEKTTGKEVESNTTKTNGDDDAGVVHSEDIPPTSDDNSTMNNVTSDEEPVVDGSEVTDPPTRSKQLTLPKATSQTIGNKVIETILKSNSLSNI